MLDQNSKELYAFLMPNGSTVVGMFDPHKPTDIEDIIIFETPVVKCNLDGEIGPYLNLEKYFALRYQEVVSHIQEAQKEGQRYAPLSRTGSFNANTAVIKFNLRDYFHKQ
jgi:hypothetical protein